MPLIPIVAFAALILIAALAIILAMLGGPPYAESLGQFIVLLVAAGNAAAVVKLARTRQAGMACIGLALVLAGVAMALALDTVDYWLDFFLPADESFFGMLARFGQAMIVIELLFWSGLLMLALGWGNWALSRFAARRAARVASRPQHPI